MNFDLASLSPSWFQLDVAFGILPTLIAATGITVYVTVTAFVLTLVLGFPLLLMRRSKFIVLAVPVSQLVEFVRSTPLLVQMYFFFFVLPEMGILLSPATTGIVAMTLHYGCYMSEVYRSSLESIPHGQWDAVTSLGFSRLSGYRHVILPQMIPPIIPASGNFLVFMFKDSPLLAAISARELMFVATEHGIANFQYLEPITMCGLIYLTLSLGSAAAFRRVEARVGRVWLGRDFPRV